MDVKFLEDIELKTGNNIKSIRFADDEVYLLKYIEYRKRRFGEYVKELIRNDLENYNKSNININMNDIENMIKQAISNMDINNKSNYINNEEEIINDKEESINNQDIEEGIDLLSSMGIMKR